MWKELIVKINYYSALVIICSEMFWGVTSSRLQRHLVIGDWVSALPTLNNLLLTTDME